MLTAMFFLSFKIIKGIFPLFIFLGFINIWD